MIYSSEQRNFLKKNRKKTRAELTVIFNYIFNRNQTYEQVRGYCKRMKFFTGRTGCYKKNHTPWLKGTKGIAKPNSGSFKKGEKPPNQMPIGATRIPDHYILVKVAQPNVWKAKHILKWEKYRGPIPKGKVLMFLDNDFTNCKIGNLICITRQLQLILNRKKFSLSPKKYKKTILSISRVEEKIFKKLKNN